MEYYFWTDYRTSTANLPRIDFIIMSSELVKPLPVDARIKSWVFARSFAGSVGSNLVGRMGVGSLECYVLSGRDLWDGPTPLPKESYRVCLYACVCFLECDQMQQ